MQVNIYTRTQKLYTKEVTTKVYLKIESSLCRRSSNHCEVNCVEVQQCQSAKKKVAKKDAIKVFRSPSSRQLVYEIETSLQI